MPQSLLVQTTTIKEGSSSQTTPAPPNPRNTFSYVLWDSVRSTIGFTKAELNSFRSDMALCSRRPLSALDCVAEVNFAPVATLDHIRSTLELYLESLEVLRNETKIRSERRFKTKSFVEDTRYTAMKSREHERRIDAAGIATHFEALNLTKRGIVEMDSDMLCFNKLQELLISENCLEELHCLPPGIRVLIANGNRLTKALPPGLTTHTLVFLSVADNRLESLGFIDAMPSLVSLDISFNRVSSIENVIEPVLDHPRIRELNLLGNPVALLPLYRIHILEICEELLILDGHDADRSPPAVLPRNDSACVVRIELSKLLGLSSLAIPPPDEKDLEEKASLAGTSRSKSSKDKSKGKKPEVSLTAAPAPVSLISLKASWIPIEGLGIDLAGLNAFPPPVEALLPHPPAKVAGKPKGKTGSAATAAASTSDASAPAGGAAAQLNADELVIGAEVEHDVPLYDELVSHMMHPLHVSLYLFQGVFEGGEEVGGGGDDGGGGGGASSTSLVPQGDRIGYFDVQLSQLVGWVSGGNAHMSFENVPFTVDSEFVTLRLARLREMRSTHTGMIEVLTQLEETTRDAGSAAGGDQQPQVAAARTPQSHQKKSSSRIGNKADTSPTPQAAQESFQRRAEVDILATQIQFEERQLQRIQEAVLSLAGSVEINPYPAFVPSAPSQVEVEVEPRKNKGGKAAAKRK